MDANIGFFAADFLGTSVWAWRLFLSIVATLLALDLGVLHKGEREIGVGRALPCRPATSPSRWCSVVGCVGKWAPRAGWRFSPVF